MTREHPAEVAATATRIEFACKAPWSDVDLLLEYDRRPRFPDVVTATVSIPLHLQQGSKQNQEFAANARA